MKGRPGASSLAYHLPGITPTPTDAAWPPALVYSAVIVAAILIALAFWISQKGRRLPGEHVFRASRFGRGNHLFPAQVLVTSSSITLYTPQWIGKLEESIHLAHVASIRIDTHLMFADVDIETSGGQNPVVCHGHTKGDAVRMKDVIERFQSEYYRKRRDPARRAGESASATVWVR